MGYSVGALYRGSPAARNPSGAYLLRSRRPLTKGPARRGRTKMPPNRWLAEIADRIDRLTAAIGRTVMWCGLAMVVLQVMVVLMRYVLASALSGSPRRSSMRMPRCSWGVSLDAAAGRPCAGRYLLCRRRAAQPGRRRPPRRGPAAAALLLRAGLVRAALCGRSWAILERSREASGLPLVFLLKTLIPVFAVLLGLQGSRRRSAPRWCSRGRDGRGGPLRWACPKSSPFCWWLCVCVLLLAGYPSR